MRTIKLSGKRARVRLSDNKSKVRLNVNVPAALPAKIFDYTFDETFE